MGINAVGKTLLTLNQIHQNFMKTYQQKGNNALLILNHKTSAKVLINSVILIKGDINYTKFYMEGGKERVVAHSIKFFETHLEALGFLRVHRSFMVNPYHIKSYNHENDVLMMTFSEFGRRVAQNASGGTDHGTANNMFFISGGLKEKGMLNAMPNLADLNEGDLKHTVDFKNVYATVLNKWLGADDSLILGKKNAYLNFV